MKLPKPWSIIHIGFVGTLRRKYFSILTDFPKMASNAFSSPANFLLPTAIIALWQGLYSCLLKLGNEIPGFLSNLSYYHVLSIAHGRAKYMGHPAKELTWFYAPCPALALFFTDLDPRYYLNQRHLCGSSCSLPCPPQPKPHNSKSKYVQVESKCVRIIQH